MLVCPKKECVTVDKLLLIKEILWVSSLKINTKNVFIFELDNKNEVFLPSDSGFKKSTLLSF